MGNRNESEPAMDAQPAPAKRITDSCFHRLKLTKNGGAVIKPDFKQLGFWTAIGLSLAIGILWLIDPGLTDTTLPQAMIALGLLTFHIFAFVVLLRATRVHVRLDDLSKTIVVRKAWFKPKRTITFQSILAVQLCWVGKQRLGHNALSTKVWQLNLILQGQSDTRMTLLTCGGEKQLRKIAHGVSGFLNIPLVESDGSQNQIIA